jgi:hypothetical protein
MNSAVVPATMTSRSLPPTLISEVPTASGATRCTALARSRACASSTVRSRGVLVSALPGLKPPVCERPGRTITRLLPIDENSRARSGARRRPAPSAPPRRRRRWPSPAPAATCAGTAGRRIAGEAHQVGSAHRISRRQRCRASGRLRARRLPSATAAGRGRRGFWSWVTTISVMPRWLSSSSRRITSSPVARSRLPVGSSARITAGCMMVARAMATRCRWPPESWSGRWSARSRPKSLSAW